MGYYDPTTTGGDSGTENMRRDRYCLFPQTVGPSKGPHQRSCWNSGQVCATRYNGSQCRYKEDPHGRKGKEMYGWKVSV